MYKSLTVSSSNQRYERLVTAILYTLLALIVFAGVLLLWDTYGWRRDFGDGSYNERFSLDLTHFREVVQLTDAEEARTRDPNCRFWNCLNLYHCGQSGHDRLTVYVYPLQDYVEKSSGKAAAVLTREYYQILEAVVRSPYYTSNPNEACLFMPSIDLLNQSMLKMNVVGGALTALNHWDSGENHIIFNMLTNATGSSSGGIDAFTDRAIILGGGFDTWTYREGFDVAIPVWSPTLEHFKSTAMTREKDLQHRYLLVAAQLNTLPEQIRVLQSVAQDNPADVLLLHSCKHGEGSSVRLDIRCQRQREYEYPRALSKGKFCLLSRSIRLGQPDLLEMLAYNCIPVIAVDNFVLPFEDVLDWSLFSVRIREAELHAIMNRLREFSHIKTFELQQHGRWVYNRYFKDLHSITLSALEILEGRIFPHRARSHRQWNTVDNNYRMAHNPLFLPLMAPKSQGFTAVILTYDRVDSLFALIQKLALVPSLQSILVVWNNQKKTPPHLSTFPTIMKPLKVIQTRANKLSNRFFPYAEIETEAILTIDDDINMLTTDELDFGFEVWREFPDRIVGFPSRIHVWDNITMSWRYESEWTNQISMVLTGAAFYHKFWSHMYTYSMPGDIKDWVDEHMNCEDIAMNFLVANITNKPPIKVTPRKKFKCPECTNTEMLSADLNHMRERSACIDRFSRIYGRMPLRSVEFRADPVLFKDNFPEKLKRFNDVGNL